MKRQRMFTATARTRISGDERGKLRAESCQRAAPQAWYQQVAERAEALREALVALEARVA